MSPAEKIEAHKITAKKLYELQAKYPLASKEAELAYRLNPEMNIVAFFAIFGYDLEIYDKDLPGSLFNLELAYSWLNDKLTRLNEENRND